MKSKFRLMFTGALVGAGVLGLLGVESTTPPAAAAQCAMACLKGTIPQGCECLPAADAEAPALTSVAQLADPRLKLQPKLTGPVSIRMNQPSRQSYETVAELAGIQIIFHRQFQTSAPFPFTVENVDIFTALDLLSFQTGNFWQVNDAHTITVAPDNPTVRREIEPMVMKTFYLANLNRQQDITELVTGLRTVLALNSISVSTPLSAITIRDTPDKVALVEQLLGNAGVLSRTPISDTPGIPSGNGGMAMAAPIPRATAIAADDEGNIFIVDSNRLRKITPDGVIRAAVAGGTSEPYAADIVSDTTGNLYIADDLNHRVRKLSPAGTVTTIAGTGRPGFSGDGGPGPSAQLNAPTKVAVDRAGSVYVADSGNGRIRKVSPNGIISTVAGSGAWGYGGDGGPAISARLGTISGLGVDGDGNIYFGDANSRVRKVTKGIVTVIAGTGTPGFSGDFGPAAGAQIEISSLAVDQAGNVFITDVNRIRRISPDGTIRTVAGNASPGFSGDNGPVASARLRAPRALAVDSKGTLYVADTLNGRIRKVANGTIMTIAGAASEH